MYGRKNVRQITDLYVAPTTVTQTVTTTRTPHQGHNANRGTPQNQGYAPGSTPQEQRYAPQNNAVPQHQEYPLGDNTTSQHKEYAAQVNPISQQQEFAPRKIPTPQNREYAPQNTAASIRPVNEGNAPGVSMSQPYRGDISSSSRANAYDTPKLQDEDDSGLAQQSPVPRKPLGTSATTPYSSVEASLPSGTQTGYSRQQIAPKALPPTPAAASLGHTDRQTDPTSQKSSVLNRSRPISTNQAGLRDAQDVVDRATTNTYDTQVVETVAPGKSHC